MAGSRSGDRYAELTWRASSNGWQSLTTTSTISGINSGLLSFNPDDQVMIESYDADGNTIAIGGKGFAYDSEDRLSFPCGA